MHELGHIIVDIGHHAVELDARDIRIALIGLGVFLGAIKRAVRRIRHDVGEERLILIGFDKFDTLIKPVVRAKSLEALQLAIHPIGIVEIVIAPIVWCLANTARAMIDGVLKTAILGAKWISVTEVPFAKDSSGVTVIAKNICHRHFATA